MHDHEGISTHDLTRRSTAALIFPAFHSSYFNSRPHKEVDCSLWFATLFQVFQLTTSQGGRLNAVKTGVTTAIFQLTTSQGGRLIKRKGHYAPFLFQLTTSQGGRRVETINECLEKVFQLTTSQGGRQKLTAVCLKIIPISTHDLTRRSTELTITYDPYRYISTHDLTRRSTFILLFVNYNFTFQLTTSQGGRQVFFRC